MMLEFAASGHILMYLAPSLPLLSHTHLGFHMVKTELSTQICLLPSLFYTSKWYHCTLVAEIRRWEMSSFFYITPHILSLMETCVFGLQYPIALYAKCDHSPPHVFRRSIQATVTSTPTGNVSPFLISTHKWQPEWSESTHDISPSQSSEDFPWQVE